MKSLRNNITFICFLYILGIFHLTLFLYEFFPVKSKYCGTIIPPPNHINGTSLNAQKHYVSNTNRVIFMVIDGLRNDFVNKDSMPYVYESITRSGCHITTKVESPTVTMPRIKAMTTGTLPQYIDLLLNFQSVKVIEDSWLQRAKDAGKHIVFYGDNTWEKLYPNMFYRSEGTTSFFVTDFTEVDDNITRHLDNELLHKRDWDILILHYLGLDHIGHIHGPFHELINTKLNEMDSIIKRIDSYTRKDVNTVIIVTGDHGMRDLGGHGGSTEPEILVPFIVLNKPCRKYQKYVVKQTDIASTLAALMAIPLPAHSVGKIIHDFLPYETKAQNLYFLHYNALNLIKMDETKYFHEFAPIFQDHINYLTNNSNLNPKTLINAYEEKIIEISNDLLRSSSLDQNIFILYLSICCLILICLKLVSLQSSGNYYLIFTNLAVTLLFSIFRDNIYFSYIIPVYCILLSGFIIYVCSRLLFRFTIPVLNFLLAGTLFRTLSMVSSSYIEFEQYIWYFLWSSVTVFCAYKDFTRNLFSNSSLWIVLTAGLRLAQNILSIHNYLNTFAWIIFITGLMGIIYTICKHTNPLVKFASISTCFVIFLYRIHSQTVFTAQLAKYFILITSVANFMLHRNITKTLIVTWLLWSALLMRPHNVILLPLCVTASQILFQLCSSIETLTLMHIWLEEILYYCQGFDNNFSSVDISPGYVGLQEYSLLYTSFQVICHTYIFRILPLLLLLKSEARYENKIKSLRIFIIYRITSFTYYCFVIFIHRHHIFIWSVFSPKLLIESCHGLCLSIIVICFLISANFCQGRQTQIKY